MEARRIRRTATVGCVVAIMATGFSAAVPLAAPASADPAGGVTVPIAAAGFHTCALTPAGGVQCWGDNTDGELGDGTTTARLTPVDVSGLSSGVAAIAAGGSDSCALLSTGGVKCWGANTGGELGDGTTTRRLTPVDVSGLSSPAIAIAAGGAHTCALLTTGGVKCWGDNFDGKLGDGTTTGRLTPVDVSGLSSGVTAIAAGEANTCAVTSVGGVKCWGDNTYGELGDGPTIGPDTCGNHPCSLTPVDVSGLSSGATAIVTGLYYSCALLTTGGVKCWGYNGDGELGNGNTTGRWTPGDVSGLSSGVTAIATGDFHSCALLATGGVRCWGNNSSHQLGDGTTTPRLTPVNVSGLGSEVSAIATGTGHSCALLTAGVVQCWGYNADGELGHGTTTPPSVPVNVSGLGSGVSAVAIGDFHSCALQATGGVKCWGYNGDGELGDGTTTPRSTPVDVSGLSSGVSAIATGGRHSCALLASDGVRCWGDNIGGELGNGTTNSSLTPVDVSGLGSGVSAIAGGDFHSCALNATGGVECWGLNQFGQVGDGTNTNRLLPVDVSGLGSGVSAIATGGAQSCALLATGGVKCWGLGGLGNGSTNSSSTPVDVSGLSSGVSAIAAGGGHTCALLATGGVKCWGSNVDGELGDGTTTERLTPVNVSGLSSGVTAIAAGFNHTCALLATGGVKCWGFDDRGQLGNGTAAGPETCMNGNPCSSTPVDVSGLSSGVVAIAAGGSDSCALLSTGGLQCWGDDAEGEVGDGAGWWPIDVIGSFRAATVPDPPTNLTATAGNGRASIALTAPANNGGSTITAYSLTCTSTDGGATGIASGPSSPIVVSGLSNGNTYTCSATATNGIGASTDSAPSNVFAPLISTVPGPPTGLSATGSDGSAIVAFTASVSDGGSAILGYSVTCSSSDGGATGSASGAGSPIVVSGLTRGNTYTCTAAATNVNGPSVPSSPSNSFSAGGVVVGGCVGQVLLVSVKPSLSDVTQRGVTIAGGLAADQSTRAKIVGTCTAPARTGDAHVPQPLGTLHPKSVALSLLGNASCAEPADDPNVADASPENGKITWTMNETYSDLVGGQVHPYKIQAAIAIQGTDPAGADVFDVGGIVLTGLAPGARVGGSVWEDPVVKNSATSDYNTGYTLDRTAAAACADATPGNASISKLLIGGGGTSATSPAGNNATGITFTLGE